MQRYLFILILCSHAFLAAHAQNADRERFLNATVYRLALEEKWDSVLYYCNLADYEFIQSYEITYNRGRALFVTERYREAWAEFEKAAETSEPGSDLKSYLYYSADFSGMHQRARYWRYSMNGAERKKNRAGYIPVLERVSAGYTMISSNNAENNGSLDFYPPLPETFDSSSWYKLNDDMQSFHASIGIGLCKSVGLNISANSLSTDDLYRLAYLEYYGADLSYTNYRATTDQLALYFSLPIMAGKRMLIEPAFHHISVRSTNFKEGSSIGEGVITDTSFAENLASLAFVFERNKATRSILFSWSSFSYRQQLQASFINTWYPKFNLNEYYTFSLNLQSDDNRPGFAAGISGGWKINRFLWAEAGLRVGKLANYNEMNGAIAFNTSDINNFLVSASPVIVITPRLSLVVNYRLYVNHLPYSLDDGSFSSGRRQFTGITLFKTNYLQNHITGGITWKL